MPNLDFPEYSYRNDKKIPAFDDTRGLLIMDGTCGACSRWARTVAYWDRKDQFRITTTDSNLGRSLQEHYGIDPDDPDSWVYLVDGKVYTSMQAITEVCLKLGLFFYGFAPMKLVPMGIQDWLYQRIARNRYRIFGKTDMCGLPSPELRKRLVMD